MLQQLQNKKKKGKGKMALKLNTVCLQFHQMQFENIQ